MKSTSFWIVRFLMVFGALWALLALVYWIGDMPAGAALREAALWAWIASSIFIASRYYQASKGGTCRLYRDTVND